MIRFIPHLLAVGALVGTVYAVYTAGHDAGRGAGYQVGYQRGAEEAYRIADANALRLLADSNAAAEKRLREVSDERQAEAASLAAEISAAREKAATDLEVIRADRDRLIAWVRSDSARSAVRPADSGSRLPETANAGTGLTIPDWTLHAADRERLVQFAYDADALNAQYSICYRWARSVSR